MDPNSKLNYQDGNASDLIDWAEKFNQKRKAKCIPAGAKGNCLICKKETLLKCKVCSDTSKIDGRRVPYYCGREHQLIHWKSGHKKACMKTTQSVFGLAYDVHKNHLPGIGGPDYNDYGFGNCKTMSEEKMLLGLYIGLIERLKCDLDDLHEACMNGRLDTFIISVFEEAKKKHGNKLYVGEYYPWFLENQHVVKNITPMKI